jgi:uncharacterized lipoprotein YmbA
MPTMSRALIPLLLCALLGVSGCFGLSREAPPQRHYVLAGDAGPAGDAVRSGDPLRPGDPVRPGPGPARLAGPGETYVGPVVGLRAPRIAAYLAAPFIVVRHGTHRVGLSEFHRWGEDLARGIPRVVAGNLAIRSPDLRVETAPWPSGTRPDYLIQLQVLRFEGSVPEVGEGETGLGEGEAVLLAHWEILGPTDGALLARGTTEVRTPGWRVGDFGALVTLLDATLGTLADDLVRGLEGVLEVAVEPDRPLGSEPEG